jgi:methyl-accepting chemotaxis protein
MPSPEFWFAAAPIYSLLSVAFNIGMGFWAMKAAKISRWLWLSLFVIAAGLTFLAGLTSAQTEQANANLARNMQSLTAANAELADNVKSIQATLEELQKRVAADPNMPPPTKNEFRKAASDLHDQLSHWLTTYDRISRGAKGAILRKAD